MGGTRYVTRAAPFRFVRRLTTVSAALLASLSLSTSFAPTPKLAPHPHPHPHPQPFFPAACPASTRTLKPSFCKNDPSRLCTALYPPHRTACYVCRIRRPRCAVSPSLRSRAPAAASPTPPDIIATSLSATQCTFRIRLIHATLQPSLFLYRSRARTPH